MIDIPIYQKRTLSIEETAAYTGIGENKLRKLVESNRNANYILWIGNRVRIKRVLFEQFVDELEAI